VVVVLGAADVLGVVDVVVDEGAAVVAVAAKVVRSEVTSVETALVLAAEPPPQAKATANSESNRRRSRTTRNEREVASED
jgi:hypothetical protein